MFEYEIVRHVFFQQPLAIPLSFLKIKTEKSIQITS
jgi:hypothetical protein